MSLLRETAVYLVLWALGVAAMLHSLARFHSPSGWMAAALAAAAFVALFKRVRLSSHDYYSYYSLEDVPLYALIYLFGAPLAVLVAGAAKLAYELVQLTRALRLHPDRVTPILVLYRFTNAPALALSTFASGWTYHLVNRGDALLTTPRNGLAIAAATVVFFLVAFGLNSLLIAVRRGSTAWEFWRQLRQDLEGVQVQVLMLAPLGALLALFVQAHPVAAPLLVVPVVLMHVALEARHKLVREAQNTIQAMAQYLDERDHYTLGHSQRVSGYAAAVAVELGLPPAMVDRARRAGLIHDIGKIDIPDSVLRKPGALTQDERAIMRTHTDRAAELARKLVVLRNDLPFHEAALHHETYDGLGSVFGLKGDKIPLVARILAVVDSYDAMTSDRPYRRGMAGEDAVRRLVQSRGTQHDPRVVDAFERAFRKGAIQSVTHQWDREEVQRARFGKRVLSVAAGS
ncbi:MAG: HD-GYP domain-containing protein [Candidatus Eremiobacterota bacterium]